MLAAVRPDSWNLPLAIHVLGAMLLVGTLVLATASLAAARRGGAVPLVRVGFRALLWAGIPAWVMMRAGAQWIADKEGYADADEVPAWIDIGFIAAEPTLLLIIAATVCAGIGLRRATAGDDDPARLMRAASILIGICLAAYLVAIWAMATKPA